MTPRILEEEKRTQVMTISIATSLDSAAGLPIHSATEETGGRLNISVMFTSTESTLAALREAGTLAGRLGAQITLFVPQVVPYPLPLDGTPAQAKFHEKRFRVIAGQSPVETCVHILLCRDRFLTLQSVLASRSIV